MQFEIRELGDGDQIVEPGFYRLPIERHHAQPCDGFSVTSSVLRTMDLHGPSVVFDRNPALNPKAKPIRDTDALRLGRVMALLIEVGPAEAARQLKITPPTRHLTMREMIALASEGKEPAFKKPNRPSFRDVQRYVRGDAPPSIMSAVKYWLDLEAFEGDVVKADDWDTIVAMAAVLADDPVATAALGGIPEITMAWRDERTGIWCLSRPDQLSFSGLLSDYKRVSPAGMKFGPTLVDMKVDRFAYDMQMGFADEGFEWLVGARADEVGLVFQSDERPHDVILRAMSEEDLEIGRFRNRMALDQIAECRASGRWPGPGEHVAAYNRRKEDREMYLERMQEAGWH